MSEEWRQQAKCRGLDQSIFFPERGSDVREALEICAACPVRVECRDYALADPGLVGIWGGMSGRGRAQQITERLATGTPDEVNDAALDGLVQMLEKMAFA